MSNRVAQIPNVGSIMFHTSNMLNWDRLKRKPILSSTVEILECVKCLAQCWKKGQQEKDLQYADSLNVECKKHRTDLEADREEFRVTAKIYLSEADPDAAKDAVEAAFNYLGVSDLDTLLVGFRWQSLFNQAVDFDSVQKVWAVLEDFVEKEKIHRLGVCDFKAEQLQELYDSSQVKPSVNQLSLNSCCVIPQDLAQYARANGIQLTSHHDAVDLVPDELLQHLMDDVFSSRDAMLWSAKWILRYSIVYKNRSVIRSKGYVMKTERDVKKLPYC